MSIQWVIIASCLYVEIVIVLLLVLPVASPKRWHKIFRSRFLAAISSQGSLYFYVLLFIFILFLLDAVREMKKYANSESTDKAGHVHLDLEMQNNMRLFRAQRNFYISGFSLFLSFVIRRLCSLISDLARAQASSEAALRQAASASTVATGLMAKDGDQSNKAREKEMEALKSEISKLKKELEAEKLDKETIKKQAESTNAEYDRLTEEFNKMQKKLHTGSEGDKKDD